MSSIYGPGGAKSNSPSKKRPRTTPKNDGSSSSTRNTAAVAAIRYNKRLLLETQRVPWIDFIELQAVGKSLLSILETCDSNGKSQNNNNINSDYMASSTDTSSMSIRDALERVELWKARCCGGLDLPHAIESTAALAQTLWKESISTSTSAYNTSTFPTTTMIMELRLSYASAVIRTINGLTDHVQQERAVATSVAHICQVYLNIPSWLVDVRHEATHNQLPTLSVLRMAARYMLQYLHDTYWQPLEQIKQGEHSAVIEYLQVYEDLIANSSTFDATMIYENGLASATSRTEKANGGLATKGKTVRNNSHRNSKGSDESDREQDHHHHHHHHRNDDDGDVDRSLLGSRLGTNINMFAVLMESKKDKKKRKLAEQQAKAEEERRLHEEADDEIAQQEQSCWRSSPTTCAEQLVKVVTSSSSKRTIPIDVLWTVLLTHFVWRPQTTAVPNNILACTTSGCCGVLVPTCMQSFPPTMKSVRILRHRYRPLLTALGQQWPGLLSALLVHIVDGLILLETSCASPSSSVSLLSNNNHSKSADNIGYRGDEQHINEPTTPTFQTIARQGQGIYFLDSWARFLLSSSFLIDSLGLQEHEPQKQPPNANISNNGKTSGDEPACREILQGVMQYPLNSLCDRLLLSLSETTTNAPSSTCRKLGRYLQDILDDHRHIDFGVLITENEDGGVLHRSLSTVGNNDMSSNESVPVVFGPCLPSGESSSSEETNSTQDEHDNDSSAVDRESLECDDAARTMCTELAADLDIVHVPKPLNHVAVHGEEKSNGEQSTMETESSTGSGLSLAQMEALLFQQNEHQTDDSTIQQSAAATPHVPQPSERHDTGETLPVTSAITAISDAQQQQNRQQQQHRPHRSPWVKCLAWDACAIGSLPGYPL